MFVFLGALTGVLGFIPLIISLKQSKKVTPKSNFGYGALLMLGVFASLIILFVAVLLCYFLASANLIEFVLATAVTLFLFAVFYGIYSVISTNKAAKDRRNRNNKKAKDK